MKRAATCFWMVLLVLSVGCLEGPIGPAGPQGEKGDAGEQGLQGSQGDTGATGATGSQGPEGDAGATGVTGPQGPQGATGATGEQGPGGAQGEQGPQGVPGDSDIRVVTLSGQLNSFGFASLMFADWPDDVRTPPVVCLFLSSTETKGGVLFSPDPTATPLQAVGVSITEDGWLVVLAFTPHPNYYYRAVIVYSTVANKAARLDQKRVMEIANGVVW
jgi:hypothetical protein